MKKKFISAILFGAFTLAATNTFVSCKDYDDDIANLQKQIDENTKAIAEIEALIQSGSVITNVASVSNGVTVTMSDGKSFTITNGADGEDGAPGAKGDPGTSWTIGEDGYWYKDGTKTEYKAIGEDGNDGTSAAARYYVPNPDTQCFDIYENGEKVEATTISFLGSGTITATMDNETLSLYGVKGATSNPLTISLTGELRSLVFIPELYLDGIETIEYPWVTGPKLITEVTNQTFRSRESNKNLNGDRKTIEKVSDYTPNFYVAHEYTAAVDTFAYGPVWPVRYHMNPSNSNVASSDVKGFNVLNPTIIETKTRAVANNNWDVQYKSTDDAGNAAFMTNNGILQVGMQINNPMALEENPTIKSINGSIWEVNENSNTVALQVNTNDEDNPTVTSDYALLLPSKISVNDLYWATAPMYMRLAPDLNQTTAAGYLGDENGVQGCPANVSSRDKMVHIYDSPMEALQDKDGAALEMYYNETDFDLTKYVGIHMMKENIKTGQSDLLSLGYGEEAKYGLSYEFNLVYYIIDSNETSDSKFAEFVSKGHLKAVNVKADESTGDQSRTAINREPLVQVLVKNKKGEVVLDGYILIHITEKKVAAPEEEKPIKEITTYPDGDKVIFDLCNDADLLTTNWSQFNQYVLTDAMSDMVKNTFDELYQVDDETVIGQTAEGPIYGPVIYQKNSDGTFTVAANSGLVKYYPNSEGTTNHRFDWIISAEEMEALTHDQQTYPVEITRYFRFKAKSGKISEAEYSYIYVKMTGIIDRGELGKVVFKNKNDNYWYGLDDNRSKDGWDVVLFDAKEPVSGLKLSTINRTVTSTLVGNTSGITETHKYYFAPKDETVTAQDGTVYTITAKSGASDTNYDKLICKYVNDSHAWNEATINDVLDKCAIDYNKGVFTNRILYAVTGGVYTAIATLNQSTSEISLINVKATRDVLNAVGYETWGDRTYLTKTLRTWVSAVAKNSCDVAKKFEIETTDQDLKTFQTAWQRPINMLPVTPDEFTDAKTEGNLCYVLDAFKLFDWRGYNTEATDYDSDGRMWGDNLWFWVYYGVNQIDVDMNRSKVLTDMHDGVYKPLADVTEEIELYMVKYDSEQGAASGWTPVTLNNGVYSWYFGNDATYSICNEKSMNATLQAWMTANKANFGVIFYKNNGDNVTDFNLRIPVTIHYIWGEFTQYITIPVIKTLGV